VLFNNQSVVAIAHKTKHMEIDVFCVRDQVLAKQLEVYHIPSLDQWADALTKPLFSSRFELLQSKLNVKDFVYKNPLTLSLRGLLERCKTFSYSSGCSFIS